MEQPPKIFKAINAIMAECPAIAKNQRNTQQNFMYRGIDVVMNVFQPLLSKHGVFAVPTVLDHQREERVSGKGNNLIYSVLTVQYTFYADDGSSVSATVIGEGMDSGDKASNKAMSVAFKYACFQLFCIPTEEMKDPDAETPPPSKPAYVCGVCKKPFQDKTIAGNLVTAEQQYITLKARSSDGVVRCEACRERAKQIPSRIQAGDINGNGAYHG